MTIAAYAQAAGADHFCEMALLRAFVLATEPSDYAWVDVAVNDFLPQCVTFWSRAVTPADVMSQLPSVLCSAI
jgi:hypothetical protein